MDAAALAFTFTDTDGDRITTHRDGKGRLTTSTNDTDERLSLLNFDICTWV